MHLNGHLQLHLYQQLGKVVAGQYNMWSMWSSTTARYPQQTNISLLRRPPYEKHGFLRAQNMLSWRRNVSRPRRDGERALHTCHNAMAGIVLNCTIWRPIVIPPMAGLPYATTSFQRISVITFALVSFPNLRGIWNRLQWPYRSLSEVCTHAEPDRRSRIPMHVKSRVQSVAGHN